MAAISFTITPPVASATPLSATIQIPAEQDGRLSFTFSFKDGHTVQCTYERGHTHGRSLESRKRSLSGSRSKLVRKRTRQELPHIESSPHAVSMPVFVSDNEVVPETDCEVVPETEDEGGGEMPETKGESSLSVLFPSLRSSLPPSSPPALQVSRKSSLPIQSLCAASATRSIWPPACETVRSKGWRRFTDDQGTKTTEIFQRDLLEAMRARAGYTVLVEHIAELEGNSDEMYRLDEGM